MHGRLQGQGVAGLICICRQLRPRAGPGVTTQLLSCGLLAVAWTEPSYGLVHLCFAP